jgi:TolB protein
VALAAALPQSVTGQGHASALPASLRSYTLLYTTRIEGDAEIVTRRLRDGVESRLTRRAGADLGGRVSPDGRQVVFHSRRDGQFEVMLATLFPADDAVNLTQHPAEDLLPTWAPDGRTIVFFSTRGEPRGADGSFRGHLYRQPLGGGEPERLTQGVITSTFGGEVSPDGRSLLHANAVDGAVWLLERDLTTETTPRRLVPGYGGTYSPSGDRIAFHHSVDGEESRLAVLDRASGSVRDVTSGFQDYEPGWSPDGEWLVFSRVPLGGTIAGVHLVSASGGPVIPLVVGAIDARSPELYRAP